MMYGLTISLVSVPRESEGSISEFKSNIDYARGVMRVVRMTDLHISYDLVTL